MVPKPVLICGPMKELNAKMIAMLYEEFPEVFGQVVLTTTRPQKGLSEDELKRYIFPLRSRNWSTLLAYSPSAH
eukprot:3889058-Pyramimonas_sp.AAC.2